MEVDTMVICAEQAYVRYDISLTGVKGTHCRSNIGLCIGAVTEVTGDANTINTRRLLETRLQRDELKFSLAA